jgi:hypothetical protein
VSIGSQLTRDRTAVDRTHVVQDRDRRAFVVREYDVAGGLGRVFGFVVDLEDERIEEVGHTVVGAHGEEFNMPGDVGWGLAGGPGWIQRHRHIISEGFG